MTVTVDELVTLIGKQAVELDQLRRAVTQIETLRADLANHETLIAELNRQLAEYTADEEKT